MKNALFAAGAAALAMAAAVCAEEGMWLMNQPPVADLKQRYQFEPSAAWLEHLQKSCVAMGASGAFVSRDGLLMTNHHVGSDQLEKLSTPQRDLIRDGFLAKTRADELKCPDYEVKVLWTIEDVTDRVNAAAEPGAAPSDAQAARRKRMSEIEAEATSRGLLGQVVTLYHGAKYHLYSYRRYADVRLVFAPEFDAAFFGGDNDNFEYPRYCLDVCFFRVYENDKPLAVEHFLKWSAAGATENELIFVCGHPGRTNRLYTLAHTQFTRDIELPFTLSRLWRREVQLLNFRARSEEFERIGGGDLFGVQNGRKARTGSLAALHDPRLMKRIEQHETNLRNWARVQPQVGAAADDPWNAIAAAKKAEADRYVRYELLGSRGISGGSTLFSIARHLVRLSNELGKPGPQRLREYRDTELDSVYRDLYSPAPIYEALEIDRLASGLAFGAEQLGGDDPLVNMVLAGKPPRLRAEQLVRGTRLIDVEVRRKLTTSDPVLMAACDDPMIRFVQLFDEEALKLRKWNEDNVESVTRDAYAKIAAWQFAHAGDSVYPDATGTLRLSYGTIQGYREDNQDVPAFTKIGGMFERAAQRRGAPGSRVPKSWSAARERMALQTPFNFVCTADIIGGNSGSPVVNRAGEVVGLIFDGNIQSLAWSAAYSDDQARAVAVDSRAIIETLRNVYDAGVIVDEILKP